jgi:bacteriorhodopsin
MIDLTPGEYSLVYNVFSFVIAAMGAAFIFFVLCKDLVSKKYRLAVNVSAVVTAVACYHYFRIFNSLEGAYVLQNGFYKPSGLLFNDGYRYVDWLLTVPLLMVELIAVLGLPWQKAKTLFTKLSGAAFAMILLGYPGEVSPDSATRMIFFILSMIPFIYIMYILYFRLGDSIVDQPESVKSSVSFLRNLTLVAWSFYPIAYLLRDFLGSSAGIVGVQVGYSIADVVAKCGYGLIIYWIARIKTENDSQTVIN